MSSIQEKLTGPQLKNLWEFYLDRSCLAERDILIGQYLHLVKYTVGKIFYNMPATVSRDDMYSSGVMGLIKAVEGFRKGRGCKFESYAIMRIKGAIIDNLRKMEWAPRSVYEKYRDISAAQDELEKSLGRQASDEELAVHMQLTVQELSKSIRKAKPFILLSLDNDQVLDSAPLSERIADDKDIDASERLLKNDLKQELEAYLMNLPEQDRNMLLLHYYEGLTGRQIAKIMGVSESRISQIHTRAIIRLRGSFQVRS